MTTRRFPKRPAPATPSPSPAAESLVARVDQQRPGETPGDTIPTGFPSIDRMLGGGLRRRDLVVLGGDIGAGKSALAPMSPPRDRKSTRLNSSHPSISYDVFCLKKKYEYIL